MPTSTPRAARPSSSRRGRRPGRRAGSTRTTSRRRWPTWSAVPGGAAGPPAPGQPLHLAAVPHRPERPLALGQRRAAGRRRPHGALLGGLGHQAGDGGRDRAGGGAQGGAVDPRRARRLRGRPAAAGGEPPARGPGEPRVVRVGGALPRHRAAPVRLQPAHPKPPHHPREPEGARSGAGGAGGPLVRRAGRDAERAARCRSIPRLRRCSRPTGSASWCCPTGSWSPRCASTGRRTGCRTTGTWCTSAAGRSAAPGW